MIARAFLTIVLLLVSPFVLAGITAFPAVAQERSAIISQDGDYFGFDLRTETEISLKECEAMCVKDEKCRAFTYNPKAKWCFLKSDFGQLQTAAGSIAGKIVEVASEPDIGAAPELSFMSGYTDRAAQYRATVIASAPKGIKEGAAALSQAALDAETSGDARAALYQYGLAVSVSPDDSRLWSGIARASMKVLPTPEEASTLQQASASAALNAYQTSRTVTQRAEALALLGQALDQLQDGRPSLEAYKASLALARSSAVEAAFTDARARHGFRVAGNTVDADSDTPRACVQFSEDLTDANYASFVTVDDAAPQSVTAENRELCVEGLKHGGRYRLTLRAGLPSAVDEVLDKPVALTVFVRDRASNVRFEGDRFVLPGTARRGVPVITTNTAKVLLDLYRVNDRSLPQVLNNSQFLSQLDAYGIETIRSDLGEPVWTGELAVKSVLNEDVTTSFPVDEAVPQRKPGIYVLTARLDGARPEEWDPRATQWFVVSDIGLTTFAGEDGLTVFARSLDTAEPLAGVALKLLAKNNDLLGETTTDADGKAVFAAGLTRGDAGLSPVAVTALASGGDFGVLDLTRAGFDLSDRGVTGRPAAGALDVYAWTERGIYRAGEVVHAQALLRDSGARAVSNLPLVFIFIRPDGVEDRRITTSGAALGGHSVDLALQQNAQRGAWTLKIHTDPEQEALAEKLFLVEDFVPDRAEFTLSGNTLTIGEPSPVSVDGRFLYGAPAAGLTLEGELVVTATQTSPTFPGYLFGLADEDKEGTETRTAFESLPDLDEEGKAVFDVSIDAAPDTTRMLNASIVVRMRENGGRAIERTLALAVTPTTDMIGIKPEFTGGQVPEGGQARFKVIAVDPSGARIDSNGLRWTLLRVDWNYQWYRDGNAWKYEPVEYTTRIDSGTVDAAVANEPEILANVTWGRFRLEVKSPSDDGPISSIDFDAGYYVPASSTETPDGLEIALDKANYRAGETAQLKISPRFAGEALIMVGTERLLTSFNVTVPEGGATVPLSVSADWGAGAYVTATLFRPGQAETTRMPMRAIGVKWLPVDPGVRKLSVAIEAPEKIQPESRVTIPLAIAGLEPGEEAYVTLAAVDVGILNLTTYEPPAPDDWYFGQRRLGLEIRDLYGRLIDGAAGEMGKLRSGGDGPQASSKGSPPTEKLLALYSGIVRIGDDGRATVSFDIPQFNGTARLMAVAWSDDGAGHAVEDLIIRDPVVIVASLPRFMAQGDSAEMLLEVANTDGPAGDYTLSVTTSGELAAENIPPVLTLDSGARQLLKLPLSAIAIGTGTVTVKLAHASGLTLETVRVVPVRSDTLPVTTRMQVPLAANGSVRVDRELLAASLLDGASVSVGVSRDTGFDIPSMLLTLDRYPYGCAEQTTSRALPLLYVSELSKAAGIEADADLKERIQGAIERVLNYQSSTGSFGLWGPASGDMWLDAYVTDFLTRAREQNYDVPEQAMLQALENLQNTIAYNTDVTSQGSEIAYALYVLARNRRASVSDLRYYSESQIDNFASPMARAQLGASLALYGDQPGAERAFASAFQQAKATSAANQFRNDYGSRLRDGAAMLALAAESKPQISSVKDMIAYVAALRPGTNWRSTQDDAWMLLAARALAGDNDSIALTVNGDSHSGAFSGRFDGTEIEETPVTIVNTGAQPVVATVTSVASPVQPLPAGGTGFTIERKYYTLDGAEANVSQVKQNERYVAVLSVNETNSWPSRILVTDLLPAGFEIDNPKIVSSAELPNFDWLGAVEYAHSEYRDDRFVAAFNRTGNEPRQFSFAYVVRAVTPGNYAHPAASVEDMYRPELSARTATGRMEVTVE